MTAAGVVLSAALITAVMTFGVSLLDYMARGAVMKYGDWHVGFTDVSRDFAKAQEKDSRVEDSAEVIPKSCALIENSRDPQKPYIQISGYDSHAFDMLPVTLLSGRLPENDNEIIISGKAATEAGMKFRLNDEITLRTGERTLDGRTLTRHDAFNKNEKFEVTGERTMKVVGICRTPYTADDDFPGYTAVTLSESHEDAGDADLFIKLSDPHDLSKYIENSSQSHSYITNDRVLRFLGMSDDRIFSSLLYSIGAVVIAIIMLGSVFLIYNSFSISLSEKMHQLGILMSVGATSRQLRNSVLFEGLCIGAAGIPAGIIAGLASIRLIISIVSEKFGNILYSGVPLVMKISLPVIAVAAAVSLVTILISAYIPARKAVRVPVLECIRQMSTQTSDDMKVKTSALTGRLFGLEGTLALKNFKRNRKRYRSIIMSLVLSIVLFMSASSFVTDTKLMAGENTEVSTYDIAFTSQDMTDRDMDNLYNKLKDVGGVTESSCQHIVTYSCHVDTGIMTPAARKLMKGYISGSDVVFPVNIQFIDDESYMRTVSDLGLDPAKYSSGSRIIAVAKDPDTSENIFRTAGLKAALRPSEGEERFSDRTFDTDIDLITANKMLPDSLPVMTQTSSLPVFISMILPQSAMDGLMTADTVTDMKGLTFSSDEPSVSASEMQDIIEGSVISTPYQFYNINRLMEENSNYTFIANVFAYTFIIMISLIAVANVFNTISTNIKMRRRELAMLRSTGMSDRSFRKMMDFECLFYGFRALIIGLPLSALISWLIYKAMFQENDISFTLPWSAMLISTFSVLFIVFITMLYATSKIRKENIIDALRDDIV